MKPLLFLLLSLGLLTACSPRKFHHYDARTGVHTFSKMNAYEHNFLIATRGFLRITPDSITFTTSSEEIPRLDSLSRRWTESERYQQRFGRYVTRRSQHLSELMGVHPTWFDLVGSARFVEHRGPRIPLLNNYSVLRLHFRDSQENFVVMHNRTSVLQRIRKVLQGYWHETLTSTEAL